MPFPRPQRRTEQVIPKGDRAYPVLPSGAPPDICRIAVPYRSGATIKPLRLWPGRL